VDKKLISFLLKDIFSTAMYVFPVILGFAESSWKPKKIAI
jgi:hypothetical protein